MARRRMIFGKVERLLIAGLLCLSFWLFSLRIPGNRVLQYMERFVMHDDGRYLLTAAAVLVAINTFRAILLYLGWFYLGESLAFSVRGKAKAWLLPLIAIPASYVAVSYFPEFVSLHFGIPALFSMITVFILHVSTRDIRGWSARSMVLSLLVFSFQCLDLAPVLTRWGFGHGELSMTIKEFALLQDWGWVLDALAFGLFGTAFAGGIGAAALLIASNRHNRQFLKIREQDRVLSALREETIQVRGYKEIQQLVHDLRRPLTTMLGLADVLAEILPPGAEREYANRLIQTGVDMNQMVGELLTEDSRQILPVSDLLEFVLSQVSAFPWRHEVELIRDFKDGDVLICINRIRFSRALVNLLDNAHFAVRGHPSPKIQLETVVLGKSIFFNVKDNGHGFPDGVLPSHSLWGSTGIGLVFVEEVIRKHSGQMVVTNLQQGGACVTLDLPIEERS